MTKFCVYCGKPVKESDKFCIHCGKPRLSSLPKTEKKVEQPSIEMQPEAKSEPKKNKKEKLKEEKIEPEPIEDDELEVEEDKVVEAKPLPDEVKQQIEYYLELNDIRLKKVTLADKLNDLQKQLKSSRYETDFEFGEKIDVQLKAVKSVMDDLKQQGDAVKDKMTDKFIVEKLDYDIDTKRDQLKNLMREHKLKKIKDKEVVKKLKEKYKNQLETFIEEKAELIAGIQLWIDDLIEEKVEMNTERKFNKARFSSKEITEEEYKEKDSDFELKLNKLESKIKTLENLTKKKKK